MKILKLCLIAAFTMSMSTSNVHAGEKEDCAENLAKAQKHVGANTADKGVQNRMKRLLAKAKVRAESGNYEACNKISIHIRTL